MLLNPRHPRWYPFILCLDDYRGGEFGKSLDCVLKMNLTKSQLVQTLLAANYGQLGESEKGEKTIDLILEIHPKFANDPGVPFRTRRVSEDLIDSVMEGLRNAGYEMPGGTS